MTKKYDRDKIVELNIEIRNQNRQIITRGVSKVKIVEQEITKEELSEPLKRKKTALVWHIQD